MKKYLISLDKDFHRRELFFAQNDTQDFIHFPAYNTMDGDENELCKHFDFDLFMQRYSRKVTKGEIGCTLSHLSVYQQIIDSEIGEEEYCLICEDDALFCSNFQFHLNQILEQGNKSDIILVGQSKINNFSHPDLEWLYPTTFNIFQKKVVNSHFKISYPYKEYYAGTVAYLIKKSAARRIIQFLKEVKSAYWLADDFILFKQRLGIDIKVIRPLMVIENPNINSNLSKARKEIYHHRILIIFKYPFKKFLAVVRNMFNRK